MTRSLIIRAPFPDAAGLARPSYSQLSFPVVVDPRSGEPILLPIPQGAGTRLETWHVTMVPVPVHCQLHGCWHATPNTVIHVSTFPLTPRSSVAHSLGLAATALLAPSCREAAALARDFSKAWTARLAPLRKELAGPKAMSAFLGLARLLDAALRDATGLSITDALGPLADTRIPDHRAINGTRAPSSWTRRVPALLRCATHGEWHTLSSVRLTVPTYAYPRLRSLAAPLAAHISTTCREADLRVEAARRAAPDYLDVLASILGDPRDRALPARTATFYRTAARGLRAALLPAPEFVLESLEHA
jgi:hypothetical protein